MSQQQQLQANIGASGSSSSSSKAKSGSSEKKYSYVRDEDGKATYQNGSLKSSFSQRKQHHDRSKPHGSDPDFDRAEMWSRVSINEKKTKIQSGIGSNRVNESEGGGGSGAAESIAESNTTEESLS
jgi:hypothetical protein